MAASSNDKYAITSAQGVIKRLGEILTDINLRLVQAESRYDATDRAAQEVANQGLRYLETVIVPAATKVADLLLSLSDLFETTSKSSVKISDPLVTFQVDPKDSNTFATLGYVIASAAGSASGLGGPVVSFDPKSGVLVLDPDFTWGAGTFSDWKLIGSPPVSAIVAATDPVLASRAQAIGNTIVADATARIAAAQALVQAVANGRVPLDGSQPMTGDLLISKTYPSVQFKQGTDPIWGWQVQPGGAVHWVNYTTGFAALKVLSDGSIAPGQIGDLKTYVDKGVRTDVAQAFSSGAINQFRKNARLPGTNFIYNPADNLQLDAGIVGATLFYDQSRTVYLPPFTTCMLGDEIEIFVRDAITLTVRPAPGDSGQSVGNFTGDPAFRTLTGGTYTIRRHDGSWRVHGSGANESNSLLNDRVQSLSDAKKQQLYANADIAIPVGQCRLNWASSTQIRLDPFNGNKIFINGNYRTIPAAGVTLSNASLSANTLYYIYAYWSGSTLSLAASVIAPVVDAAYGYKRPGNTDAFYNLVGAVVTGGSSEFLDNTQFRQVASYFNRARKHIELQVTGGGASANQSYFNLGGEVYIFSWGDEATEFTGVTSASNNAATQALSTQCYIDGVAAGQDATAHNPVANSFVALTCAANRQLSPGLHKLSIYGKTGGNTATYYTGMYGTVVL